MADDRATKSTGGARYGKVLVLALFVGVIVAFFAFGGQRYLDLGTITAHRDALLALTQEHFALTLALAFLVYTCVVAFSIPAGALMTLTMGFLFGRWVGTAVVVVAATVGATVVFVAARYTFADAARKRLGDIGTRINAGFTENAFQYMLFLRLVPVFPFFLVNLAPALTSIPVRTFALATLIGIIPASFVYANLGQTLTRIDSLKGLVSVETLGALALLGLLALLPILWKRRGASSPPRT